MNNDLWYDNLNKSPLNPGKIIFKIVWPVLYTILAIYFILIFKNPNCNSLCDPLLFFFLQLIFNLGWSAIFFKYKKIKLSLFVIFLIIILSVITFIKSLKISKIVSYLLIPYILWLCFAFYLNLYIVLYN